MAMVRCPICDNPVPAAHINAHLDAGCVTHVTVPADDGTIAPAAVGESVRTKDKGRGNDGGAGVASFFRPLQNTMQQQQRRRKEEEGEEEEDGRGLTGIEGDGKNGLDSRGETQNVGAQEELGPQHSLAEEDGQGQNIQQRWKGDEVVWTGQKRSAARMGSPTTQSNWKTTDSISNDATAPPPAAVKASPTEPVEQHHQPNSRPSKRLKPTSALYRAQPLAERMRPKTLDQVQGQDLVGPDGVLRNLIQTDKIPSMILWGGAGTGKTTTVRLMAQQTGARFVEINSTSTGVAELKKLFAEARAELGGVAGRKTIIFCDEIHRFSRSQQDVFLGPVEAGTITLVGATTENPSFKVQAALLSRCRVFTLKKLDVRDVKAILMRAVEEEGQAYGIDEGLVDQEMVSYLAHFADGDARTGLNLLELAMDLSSKPGTSKEGIKASLTKTLVYDRAGDQHYDTISAFHKSVRGSDPDAALYYLARMIQSGEDPLYIARRMVVIASEDIGLADNSMLTLATSAYAAAEKLGMPEARINLAHCAAALALSKKSTRAYRGLDNAVAALKTPGVAGLPIPVHLRNAPTRLMKEMGYGREYKYNPQYLDGKVKQEYLPEELSGSVFLEDRDLGTDIDEDLVCGE